MHTSYLDFVILDFVIIQLSMISTVYTYNHVCYALSLYTGINSSTLAVAVAAVAFVLVGISLCICITMIMCGIKKKIISNGVTRPDMQTNISQLGQYYPAGDDSAMPLLAGDQSSDEVPEYENRCQEDGCSQPVVPDDHSALCNSTVMNTPNLHPPAYEYVPDNLPYCNTLAQ